MPGMFTSLPPGVSVSQFTVFGRTVYKASCAHCGWDTSSEVTSEWPLQTMAHACQAIPQTADHTPLYRAAAPHDAPAAVGAHPHYMVNPDAGQPHGNPDLTVLHKLTWHTYHHADVAHTFTGGRVHCQCGWNTQGTDEHELKRLANEHMNDAAPAVQRRPRIGHAVHYQSHGTPNGEYRSECRAAIITATDVGHGVSPDANSALRNGQDPMPVALTVLNPDGTFLKNPIYHGEPGEPGRWHWDHD